MRRAARLGLLFAAAVCWLPCARAQTVPVSPPASVASLAPDSVKAAPPAFVADTARHAAVVTAGPTQAVTRPLALRIGAVIVVFTLTTLLLYNVRSR